MKRQNKLLLFFALVLFLSPWAQAADTEGCLSCHRYRGLARLESDKKTVNLFYIDSNYYERMLGPHARLICTDCHNRDQVAVIPHKSTSPVDCTKECHLPSPQKLEVKFSHERIANMLKTSAHNFTALKESNAILGLPLRGTQSQCLLCHNEPTFIAEADSWARREAPINRCNVCHDNQLPVNTSYYYWHVTSRSKPQHNNQDLVKVCAVCHSEKKINEHFKMPNTITSYLASFHGKATMLGSQKTANCLDCHAGKKHNVHTILSYKKPDSPTNSANLADTCRSPSCHATAGHKVSSAAVHLEFATSRGIEFFIACLFILMILFTFGPSAVLTGLELLQIVIGRHDPQHKANVTLTEKLLAIPKGRNLLKRFTPHQRIQHWLLFACFTTLVLTGFPIKFADTGWAKWLIDLFGGISIARMIHRWAGAILLTGFAYHFIYLGVYIWRQMRQTGKGLIRVFLDLPMVMNLHDWKHMVDLLKFLLFLSPTRPKAGRFSTEEKFEYFGVFWGTLLLGFTGILLWANPLVSRYLPGRVLTIALVVHSFEAFLALLHVGIVHMVGVIFSPGVFPISKAMFTGIAPPEEMAEAHSAMIEQADRQLKSEGAK